MDKTNTTDAEMGKNNAGKGKTNTKQAAEPQSCPTFCHQQDVIKQVVGLGSRLQQRDHGGVVESVRLIPQELDYGVGGTAVQAGADLVHEEDLLGAHHHFTCSALQASEAHGTDRRHSSDIDP